MYMETSEPCSNCEGIGRWVKEKGDEIEVTCVTCGRKMNLFLVEPGEDVERSSDLMSIDEPEDPEPWPDPASNMLEAAPFNAVWNCVKHWDINVFDVYAGYCGATGNHVRAILASLKGIDPADLEVMWQNDDDQEEYRSKNAEERLRQR